MLELARKIGGNIIINDDIQITALQIKGNQIHIGIDAPKNVSIHREEVYRRIQAEKTSSEAKIGERQ